MFADVYVPLPIEGPFTYKIPQKFDVKIGCRVKIPFGRRQIVGFVIKIHNNQPKDFKVKEIYELIDETQIFDNRLISLAKYTASTYICSTGEVLATALPSATSDKNRYKENFDSSLEYSIKLTDEQREVSDSILEAHSKGESAHLIYGITGSGKTEVYIDIAKNFLEKNQSVIYLVPEISLSSQIYKRLLAAFKDDLVIYHSNLTQNQRLNNWKKFYSGEAKIVIGTRSAVFMQCPELGMIIIDEEHDGSYKENSTPRYNARRISLYRAKIDKSLIVFGSATPSIESLYSAEKNIFKMHKLNGRYGKATLPEIEVVNVNSSRPDKMLSTGLKLHTKKALDNGHQAIYLLNRRGFSPIVLCDDCSTKIECPHCNISMNSHNDGLLVCHYCGFKIITPEKCPECGHDKMVKVGAGTQRIEEVVDKTFHNYKIFRLDQDTSRKKETIFDLVKKMENGEIDILLGTQMVSKGFDFGKVAIVGVLLADIGMNLPDFRATERIFSLLMQVAGRCGRGEVPGKVIVQTLNSDLEIFDFLKNHDYTSFYNREIEIRKVLQYPPFSRITRLLVRGLEESYVKRDIEIIAEIANKLIKNDSDKILLLGPSPAPLSKIGGNYRYHIILKSKNSNIIKEVVKEIYSTFKTKDTYLEIDVDPYDML